MAESSAEEEEGLPDNTLMAAAVNGEGPQFEVGAVRPLFVTQAQVTGSRSPFDVSADGQRFLLNTHVKGGAASEPITLVVNWTAGLAR